MHEEKELDEYIRSSCRTSYEVEPGAKPARFSVRNLDTGDTFQGLKYDVMAYFEDKGYRCERERASFEPSARKLYFRTGMSSDIVLMVEVIHRPYVTYEGTQRLGSAYVTIKRRGCTKQ